jgi:hypothetical protein
MHRGLEFQAALGFKVANSLHIGREAILTLWLFCLNLNSIFDALYC